MIKIRKWSKDKPCPGCGTLILGQSQFCRSCARKGERCSRWKGGNGLTKDKPCPECGRFIERRSEFCKSCAFKREKNHNWVPDRIKVTNGDRELNFPEPEKQLIKFRSNYHCQSCGTFCKGSGQVDHIIAIMFGGTNILRNGRLLCPDCHKSKTRWEKAFASTSKNLENLKRFTKVFFSIEVN